MCRVRCYFAAPYYEKDGKISLKLFKKNEKSGKMPPIKIAALGACRRRLRLEPGLRSINIKKAQRL